MSRPFRSPANPNGFREYEKTTEDTGCECQVREMQRTGFVSSPVLEALRAEHEILGSISHKYIQKFLGACIAGADSKSYVQYIESESTNLLQFYREDFPLTEKVARHVFGYLVTAVAYLHANDIVHLNIRPDCVFVGKMREFKLGGFFYAKFASRSDVVVGSYGTPNFQAPEVFGSHSFDGRKADVWACGVFLLSLLIGKLPFDCPADGRSSEERYNTIKKQITEEGVKIPEYLSTEVQDLLARMLAPSGKRESIESIMQHPWLQGASDSGILPRPFKSKEVTVFTNEPMEKVIEDLKMGPFGQCDEVSFAQFRVAWTDEGFQFGMGIRVRRYESKTLVSFTKLRADSPELYMQKINDVAKIWQAEFDPV